MQKLNKLLVILLLTGSSVLSQVNVNAFKAAIASTESKHDSYKAWNRSSNCVGKYQFKWVYVPQWVKKRCGNTISGYLNNPGLQEEHMSLEIQRISKIAKQYSKKFAVDIITIMQLIHWQGDTGAYNVLASGSIRKYMGLLNEQRKIYEKFLKK